MAGLARLCRDTIPSVRLQCDDGIIPEAIAVAAQYVLGHVPDAAQKLGADQAAIESLVEAKLTQLVLGQQPAPAAPAGSLVAVP
jgi:hypothetical protein